MTNQTDGQRRVGEVIVERLEARQWSWARLAMELDGSLAFVKDLVAGQQPMDAKLARDLAATFESSPQFWIDLASGKDGG